MSTKALLIVTFVVEAGTGVSLLAVPSFVVELLLGEGLSSPQGVALGRVTGSALIALAAACWLVRNTEPQAQSALVTGMLIYNLGVPIILIHSWIASDLAGLALWPATVLHVLLAGWCIRSLRPWR